MVEPKTGEIMASSTPDGQALIRLDGREFYVKRRDDLAGSAGAGLCPIEMIGASLAA